MITEQELRQAIAECQGEHSPNANTCYKLAAYLIILNELYGKNETAEIVKYSYDIEKETAKSKIDYLSDTEFSKMVHGKSIEEIMPVFDELMGVLQLIKPNLYDAVLRKLKGGG